MKENSPHSLGRLGITADTIRTYDRRIPRYTSYPTAPVWTEDVRGPEWARHLEETSPQSGPLSLYVHIPFCRKRCLFCACNVIATRRQGMADQYLDDVEREVGLVRGLHRGSEEVMQLHLGGGTPNYLNSEEMKRLLDILKGHFQFSPGAEQSIEVDPRIATREEVFRLRQQDGFNRISYGVQDFNDDTQAAIGREQSREASFSNIQAAREAGFESVNIDLIYGLPRQSPASWHDTIGCVLEAKPDRIALYNFAYLPGRLPNHRRLEEKEMPSPAARIEMFMEAHDRLTANGWRFLGMDHYAREDDSLTRAFERGTMRRNFMGYTTLRGTDVLAFGVSSIGDFQSAFGQNTKKLNVYRAALAEGLLPVERGMVLSEEDILRRNCIESLMCQARLDLKDERVAEIARGVRPQLEELAADGLVRIGGGALEVTLKGQMFLRNIAVVFDAYMQEMQNKVTFSRAV